MDLTQNDLKTTIEEDNNSSNKKNIKTKSSEPTTTTTTTTTTTNSNNNNNNNNNNNIGVISNSIVNNNNNNNNSNYHNNYGENYSYAEDNSKLLLIMVGLPARGKTFIARKISSYLAWLGIRTKSFNIGAYRRIGAKDTLGKTSADFFDPSNEEATKQRELFAKLALVDAATFLYKGGQVAILDGTNSTTKRRSMIRNFFQHPDVASTLKVNLVFVESECRDEKLIDQNILSVKLTSPDYAHVAPQEAVKDFKQRIKHYEDAYQGLREEEGSFIKLIDAGKYVIGHMIRGYLPSRILYFLMHINLKKKVIFFTRHGESEHNVNGKIGGDADLSAAGKQYAKAMADWIMMQPEFYNKEQGGHMQIWCSTLKRTVQTANAFKKRNRNVKVYQWKALNELDAGICEGKTYKQIQTEMPEEFAARSKDKLGYRYPQGESYKDVIQRLEPVMFELERSTQPVLIIAHRAVLRCLYSYFMDEPMESIPHIPINLHTLYKLSPRDYKTEVDRFSFDLMSSKLNSDPSHE